MNKNLNRELIWHLRYQESLINAALDTELDEKKLNALAFHLTQFEKILTSSLPQGGGWLRLSCLRKKFSRLFTFWRISEKKCAMSELPIS